MVCASSIGVGRGVHLHPQSGEKNSGLIYRKNGQTCKRRSEIPLNLTLTIALTLLTLLTLPTLLTLLTQLTLPTLLQSTVFNMVQEFGTAVYRIAEKCVSTPPGHEVHPQPEQESIFRTVFAGWLRFGGIFRRSLRVTTKRRLSTFMAKKVHPQTKS